ncbi:MAG: hypothetical protein GTO29_14685 [Candidatus Latescibacteria bacterium]|nr:hypothetical protein [Candidatus Latescibacterota bacterium]NIO57396.1 hypothetical protein [Candidatus Latescibacterota bacterium]
MEDRKLDAIIREIACERYVPSEKLVRRTKATIRGRRLLQAVVFLSFCTQLLAVGIVMFLLTSPEVQLAAKIAGAVGLFAYMGCLVVATVAARDQVIRFFRRIEQLIA